jgi:hypothetical protein
MTGNLSVLFDLSNGNHSPVTPLPVGDPALHGARDPRILTQEFDHLLKQKLAYSLKPKL